MTGSAWHASTRFAFDGRTAPRFRASRAGMDQKMFLIRTKNLDGNKSPKKTGAAHLWDGSDTLCRMFSTGGINAVKYELSGDAKGRPICTMCRNKKKKNTQNNDGATQ